jgi:hypothetical protein
LWYWIVIRLSGLSCNLPGEKLLSSRFYFPYIYAEPNFYPVKPIPVTLILPTSCIHKSKDASAQLLSIYFVKRSTLGSLKINSAQISTVKSKYTIKCGIVHYPLVAGWRVRCKCEVCSLVQFQTYNTTRIASCISLVACQNVLNLNLRKCFETWDRGWRNITIFVWDSCGYLRRNSALISLSI